jgi:ubiquitin carboxyl-terminal hydrolase 4/11/15
MIGCRGATAYAVSWQVRVDRTSEMVAFEVPDPEKFYIQAVIKMKPKKLASERASHVFLLAVDSQKFSRDQMLAEVERKLAPLYEPHPDIALGTTASIVRTAKNLKAASDVKFGGANFVAFIGTLTISELKDKPIVPSRYNRRSFDNLVTIFLNPETPFEVPVVTQSVSIPRVSGSHEEHSLADCFAFFTEPEVLDEANQWFCPHCREHVCAKKQAAIWSVPEVMVIQLKRFIGTRYSLKKLDIAVDFPEEIDMKEFIGDQSTESCCYRLFAVSNHSGGLGGGHYTAHAIVQNPFEPPDMKPKWYSFNDSSAASTRAAAVHTSSAYVLFYERIPQLTPEVESPPEE